MLRHGGVLAGGEARGGGHSHGGTSLTSARLPIEVTSVTLRAETSCYRGVSSFIHRFEGRERLELKKYEDA